MGANAGVRSEHTYTRLMAHRVASGLLLGIAAGSGVLVVELGARVAAGIPTLPELVQDRLVLMLPGPVFSFLLEHLLYLGKPLFFTGLLALEVFLGALGGLVYARYRHPLLFVLAPWILNEALLVGFRGSGTVQQDARVTLTTLAGSAAYGLLLATLNGDLSVLAKSRLGQEAPNAVRRSLLATALLLPVSALLGRRVLGAGVEAGSGSVAAGDLDASVVAAGVTGLPQPVTSPSKFYIVSKNLTDPTVDAASWRLRVSGLVRQSLSLAYDEIRALPTVDVPRTLECISNDVGGDLMSNGVWTGVRLSDVLQMAGPTSEGTVLSFLSVDGYRETMSVAKAQAPDTLLVFALDREPLPAKHGFPLRLLGAGTYGMKNPKWLTEIEVASNASPGFWEQQDWNPDAPVQTMARIDSPVNGAAIADADTTISGVAFAADRGIQRVEVSVNGGQDWALASLLPSLGPSTWAFWYYRWIPESRGRVEIVARATDGDGVPQEEASREAFPNGASGLHRIHVSMGPA